MSFNSFTPALVFTYLRGIGKFLRIRTVPVDVVLSRWWPIIVMVATLNVVVGTFLNTFVIVQYEKKWVQLCHLIVYIHMCVQMHNFEGWVRKMCILNYNIARRVCFLYLTHSLLWRKYPFAPLQARIHQVPVMKGLIKSIFILRPF